MFTYLVKRPSSQQTGLPADVTRLAVVLSSSLKEFKGSAANGKRGIWGKSDRKSTPWTHINVLLRRKCTKCATYCGILMK